MGQERVNVIKSTVHHQIQPVTVQPTGNNQNNRVRGINVTVVTNHNAVLQINLTQMKSRPTRPQRSLGIRPTVGSQANV